MRTVKKMATTCTKRIINDQSLHQFKNLLKETDWSVVYAACNQGDSNLAYSKFMEIYKIKYEQTFAEKSYIPNKRNAVKQPWMTRALLKSCKEKSLLYKKIFKSPSEENIIKFVIYRN